MRLLKKHFTLIFSTLALSVSLLTFVDTIKHSYATPTEKVIRRGKYTVVHKYDGIKDEYQAKDIWMYGGALSMTRLNGKKDTIFGGVIIATEN